MKYKSLLFWALLCPLTLCAEQKATRAEHPHELSIGIGEGGHFTFGGWYAEPNDRPDFSISQGMSVEEVHALLSQTYIETTSSHRLPHFFVDYQYRFKSWLGAGLQVDFLGRSFDMVRKNGYGDEFNTFNMSDLVISIVPQLRFTFVNTDWVNLYAGGGVGYAMFLEMRENEVDDVYHSMAIQLTPIGISIGKNHFFVKGELGLLMRPAFGLITDRLGSISVGVRF